MNETDRNNLAALGIMAGGIFVAYAAFTGNHAMVTRAVAGVAAGTLAYRVAVYQFG